MNNPTPPTYDKDNLFKAKIVERIPLCKPGSKKNTHHITLDLSESNLTYEVGDCIAILPENDPDLVEKTLHYTHLSPSELILDKRQNKSMTLLQFFLTRAKISGFSRKFAKILRIPEVEQREAAENYHVWDAIQKWGMPDISPQEFADLMMPLTPRFYSIASSMKSVGDRADLTVALLQYDSNNQPRLGVCTHWLCTLAQMGEPIVPLYIHQHSGFTLPKDPSRPIIMVGPGTGIAPYRGFMQERLLHQGAKKNWLFFGEWHRNKNFYYEEFWLELERFGKLKLDLAFSRDQGEKIYVQHKMIQKGKELFSWLQEGAHFYVCGDASRMAKDVDQALHQIVQTHGKMGQDEARGYVKQLKSEGRYLRDIY
jgi:sulfite reductase (NADPH) flavoprotein alpha-component